MKWIRRLFILGLFVIFLLGIGVWFLSQKLNDLVRIGIVEGLPPITGTKVTLDRVALSPLSGYGEIHGFILYNPEGFQTEHAFAVKHGAIQVDLNTLREEVVVIREISVEGAEVTYEFGKGGNNIRRIKEHVEKVLGASESKKKDGETEVIIDRFALNDSQVGVSTSFLKGRSVRLALPPIELTGIGRKEGGVTREEAIQQILDQLGTTIEKTVAANQGLLDNVKGKIGERLGGGNEKAEEILKSGTEKVGEVLEEGKEKTDEVVEKLKGLFGR